MKTNVAARNTAKTHEGASALPVEKPKSELRRAVLSCLLFENTFYEKGSDIAQRIAALSAKVDPAFVLALAKEARSDHGLRHVSLWLALQGLKAPGAAQIVADHVILRADELAEIVALYWKQGKKPLPAALKRALALAFGKFSAANFAKYDRDGVVKLRDVMFLVHPKPADEIATETFKAIASRTLTPPDTWEVALSSGADKKATWERLLSEEKLGALAMLRNLDGMSRAGVSKDVIRKALGSVRPWGVLPWQILGAAKAAPWAEAELEALLFKSTEGERLPGKTVLLVDVSGSMDDQLSGKGERTRLDAACALAMVAREVCEDCEVCTFSQAFISVPPRRGFALAEAIVKSQGHQGTFLGQALGHLAKHGPAARLIVITDEQAHDSLPNVPQAPCYMVNVSSYKPVLQTSGKWVRIDGWSDRLLHWIKANEDEAVRAKD